MALYQTEGLLKEANKKVPTAAQLAAALLFLGAYASDKSHRKQLMEEAAMMNQMARMMESRRMQSTIDALGKQASAELSALKAGQNMAQMEKDAFGGALLGRLGRMLPTTGTSRLLAAQKAAPAAATPAATEGGRKLFGWKSKLLGAAALGGTGYMGFKGMQAARDYMMMPTGYGGVGGRWGARPPLQHRVSQYGYPVYG
jgi:hypothetical protein